MVLRMGQITYCLICLKTEVKMYCMNSMMSMLYYELISNPHYPTKQNMYACYECAYLLQKYEKFKRKCQKAYNILCSLSGNPLKVTEHMLHNVDREQHQLGTALTMFTIVDDHRKQESDSDDELDSENFKFDPIAFDNTSTNIESDPLHRQRMHHKSITENEFDQRTIELKKNPEHDINDDQFTQTFQLENPNYKSDGKLTWLTIKIKDNNKSHSQSPSELKDNCFDNEHYNTEIFSVDNSVDMDNIQTEENKFCYQEESDTNECNKTNYIEIMDTETEKEKFNMEKECNAYQFKEALNNKTRKEKSSIKKECDTNETHEHNNSVVGNKLTRKKKLIVIGNKLTRKKKLIHNKSSKINLRMKPDSKLDPDTSENTMTATKFTLDEIQREFLLRKESSNYKDNPFKCDLCYRGFKTNATYLLHLKRHTSKYGAFQCDICKLCYTSKYRLSKHQPMHKIKYSCNICTFVCFSSSQSSAHKLFHAGKEFTCKECGIRYKHQNSLLGHVMNKHGKENVCEFCGSTFTTEKGLIFHKERQHKQDKNEQLGPRCDDCSVHFASELAWKRHRVLCSRHQVQFGCQVCGDEFRDSDSLQRHAREHSQGHRPQEERRRCKEKCSKKADLRTHLVFKHPSRAAEELRSLSLSNKRSTIYVCEFCGKVFHQRVSLDVHKRTHSDEKPYSCLICGMRTNYKTSMALHQKIHTEEDRDKFQCDICGRPFDSKNRLTRHIKGHMNIRPYKCAVCDKSFQFPCDERSHYKHAHENVPYPKKNDDPTKKRRTKGRPYAKLKIIDNI